MSASLTPTNPTIVFNEIPYEARVPGTSIEVRPNYANIGLVDFPAALLVIGQMLSTGTATPDEPQLIWNPDQATSLFGAGSVAEDMVKTALLASPTSTLTAIGVADAAGATKATTNLVISGVQTASGTIALYVNGRRIAVPVGSTDSLTTIQSSVATAVADATKGKTALPVTVGAGAIAANTLTVPITAVHGGLVGNEIDIRTNLMPGDATPPGLSVSVAAMAGGATNPTIDAAITNIAAQWFTDIAVAWNDATTLTTLTTELNRRYNAMVRLDATGYVSFRGSVGTLATLGNAQNCPFLVAPGLAKPVSPSWVVAASLAAVCCFNLTNDPARQLRGLPLPGVIGSAPADRFAAYPDENSLLYDGVSVLRTRSDYSVVCERVISTYQTSGTGVADAAWLDIMVAKVMTRIRHDWRSYVEQVYPRNKLADDGALAAQYDSSIVTPSRMKASWAGRVKLYEQYGWIEDGAASAAASVFTRDATDRNRLNARQNVRIIGNLMILDGVLEFAA